MQTDISKNKIYKLFFTFIFALVGVFYLNTSKVYAGLDDSAIWGVTANFDAKAFDGSVIDNTNGKYLEKYHSLFYCYGSVPLKSLTTGMPKIDDVQLYNTFLAMTPGDNNKCNVNTSASGGGFQSFNKFKSDSISKAINNNWVNAEKELRALSDGEAWDNLIDEDFGPFNYSGKSAGGWRKVNAVYTWPGPNGAGDISEQEKVYMSKMSSVLINSYNDAIATILNQATGNTTFNTTAQKFAFLDFASNLAVNATTTNSKDPVSFNDSYGQFSVKYSIRSATDEEFNKSPYAKTNGINKSFLRVITVQDNKGNEESILVIIKYPKGYAQGQDLYGILSSRASKVVSTPNYTIENLDWTHVVYQAMFNFNSQNIDSYGMADLMEKDDGGIIGRAFSSLINSIVNGISNILGLYSLEELCLNTGGREITYWNGIFPSTWFTASQYFYLFTFTLSMLMLIIALVRLAGAKAASTIGNVAKRISLIEGIKKIIICAVATMLFVPIFQILVQLNSMMVEVLKSLIPEGKDLGFSIAATSGMGLAGAIIGIMIFWVTLKMNFTYILRGITILICYILGPVAIMCSAMGDKFAMITSNWLKELVGNIFIQTIHAMIMMVYINIAGTGGIGRIEKLVIFYSFIPLTEFIRTNLFNLGKGLNDVADNLSSGISDAAGAVTSAAIMNRRFNSLKGGNSSASGDVALKDKSSSLNNVSSEGMPEGKVGLVGGTIQGVKNAGRNIKAAGGRIASDAKNGSLGGNMLRGIGGAARGADVALKSGVGAFARTSLAAGMALGSGAANSQGRMSMGATRAFGAATAEGINSTMKDVGEIGGDFTKGYNSREIAESGFTAGELKNNANIGLDVEHIDRNGNAMLTGVSTTEANGHHFIEGTNGEQYGYNVENGKIFPDGASVHNAGKINGEARFTTDFNKETADGMRNAFTRRSEMANEKRQISTNKLNASKANFNTKKAPNKNARTVLEKN